MSPVHRHLERRIAAVTGASNGIGAAVAERLRQDGMEVIGLDIEPCGFVPSVVCDVAEIEGHEGLVDRLVRDHGPLWALVNVAGIFIPETVDQLTVAAYRRQLGVMLDGPVWLARAAGLAMARTGGGRIVNVTSIHATNSERSSLTTTPQRAGSTPPPAPSPSSSASMGCW